MMTKLIARAQQQKIFAFCVLAITATACGIYETKGASPTAESAALTASPSTQITYAQVNQLVISQSCLSCHSDASARGGVALTSFTKVNAFIDQMKNDIDSGRMPKGGSLSSSQIALFDQWYAQGHLEFGGTPTASPTASPIPTATPILNSSPTPSVTPTPAPVLIPGVTFAQVNQAIFQTSCLQCHNSTSAKAGVMVDSFADVSKSLSAITSEINAGKMPPRSPLTAAQTALFDAWIAQGANQ